MSAVEAGADQKGTAPAAPSPATTKARARASGGIEFLQRYGVLLGLLGSIVLFSLLKPDTFPTVDNARSMLMLAAPLAIVSIGLTAVLVVGDFDLSFAALIGLAGVVAMTLIVKDGWAWPLALLAAVAVGALGGLLNGVMVARFGAPSFIATLAVGTIFTGIEFQISDQNTIFGAVPEGYSDIARARPILDLSLQTWWAFAIAVLAWVLLNRSEVGRYMYATGSNREASELSGLNVRKLRTLAFVLVGTCAGFTGVILTAQAAASSPEQGAPLLLPAFAAAFLGAAMSRRRQFNVWGTVIGVVFLQVIATGLTMLALETAQVLIVQGAILAGAILLSLVGKDARAS